MNNERVERVERDNRDANDAPDIDLPDQFGRRRRLADHRGKPVILIFHRHLE